MKDTLITARRKKTELITLLVCFILANLANVYAIIAYHTHWSELITSFFYVLIAFVGIYLFWTVLRLFFYGVKALLKKKRK